MNLKIASFNLRYDKPDPDDNAWTKRRTAIAELIRYYAPDILGTQEGMAHQLLDLHRLLPGYQSVGCDRLGNGLGEHCAIFYRTDRVSCLKAENFWLSETPNEPGSRSPDWGNPVPRMATWAMFAIDRYPQLVGVCNTHLDYDSKQARERQADLIGDRLPTLIPGDAYLFVTGDFNCPPDDAPRQRLLRSQPNQVQLRDALEQVPLSQQMTYHEFTGIAFAPVDTVYYDSRIRLHDVTIDHDLWQGIMPSDHFPVIAEFVLPRAAVS